MARKKFTDEEMSILKGSIYVLEVTPSMVHFSAEFKERFWDLIVSGKTPRKAIIELGINPDILGQSRVNGLKIMIGNEVKGGQGFKDIATTMTPNSSYVSLEAKVRYLEHKLAYKEQEIEFLKKIVSLGKEVVES